MQLVSLRIRSVFGLRRSQGYDGKLPHTTFGFSSESLKKFALEVPGHPEIKTGHLLVILLASKDDWTKSLGWVNVTTGEIAAPQVFSQAIASIALLLALSFLLTQLHTTDHWSSAAALLFGSLALYWGYEAIKAYLIRGALRQVLLLARTETANPLRLGGDA